METTDSQLLMPGATAQSSLTLKRVLVNGGKLDLMDLIGWAESESSTEETAVDKDLLEPKFSLTESSLVKFKAPLKTVSGTRSNFLHQCSEEPSDL